MRAIQSLIVEFGGEQVQLVDKAAGFYLLDMTGLDVRADVLAHSTPARDGETFDESYLPARDIIIALALVADSSAQIHERWRDKVRQLSPRRVARANDLFTLYITAADGVERAARGIFTRLELEQLEATYAAATLVFRAPHPGLFDPVMREVSASLGAGSGFSFPLSFPASFASLAIDDRLIANNRGDLRTWPTVVVMGPGDNPVVENETLGKTLSIAQEQDIGDYITVDMDAATVMFYDASAGTETNIIEKISTDSEFWYLQPGENTVHVHAEGAPGGSIAIRWYDRYLSV